MGDKFFMYFRLLRGKTLVLWITNLITNLSCVKQESNWEEHRFEVNGAHHFCLFYMIFQNNIPSPQPLLPPFPSSRREPTWTLSACCRARRPRFATTSRRVRAPSKSSRTEPWQQAQGNRERGGFISSPTRSSKRAPS